MKIKTRFSTLALNDTFDWVGRNFKKIGERRAFCFDSRTDFVFRPMDVVEIEEHLHNFNQNFQDFYLANTPDQQDEDEDGFPVVFPLSGSVSTSQPRSTGDTCNVTFS